VRRNPREWHGPGPADKARIVNDSIRQTLTRSLYTVLAVAVGAVSLFFLGAEPLQMFSLAIFLGLVCGTYSSIFIAPAAWHALARRVSTPAT
jgi:SecD/SecF fusion protein